MQTVDRVIPLTGETRLLRELPTAPKPGLAVSAASASGSKAEAKESGASGESADGASTAAAPGKVPPAAATTAAVAAATTLPPSMPPVVRGGGGSIVRVTVHEFRSRSTRGMGKGRLLGEAEENRLCHVAEVLRHHEAFVEPGQAPGATPLCLTVQQRKDKHKVRGCSFHALRQPLRAS